MLLTLITVFGYLVYQRNFQRIHDLNYWISESRSIEPARRLRSGIALSRFDDPRIIIPLARLLCDGDGSVEYQTREVIGFLTLDYKRRLLPGIEGIKAEAGDLSDDCVKESLSDLIRIIQSAESAYRNRRTVEEITKGSRSPDVAVRMDAFKEAIYIADSALIPVLIEAARCDDPKISYAAQEAIRSLGSNYDGAFKVLKVLSTSPDGYIRMQAISGMYSTTNLSENERNEAVKVMLAHVKDSDAYVRAESLSGLDELSENKFADVAKDTIRDESPLVRRRTLERLCRKKNLDPDLAKMLSDSTADADPHVREWANRCVRRDSTDTRAQ